MTEPGPGGNNFAVGFHVAQQNGHAPNARYDALGELREHLRRQTTTPAGYFDRRLKHLASRLLAGLLFVLGLPIMLGAMLLMRLTSPGPTIYRQTRVGKGGKTFVMYKIRSMGRHAEAASGPVWTKRRDPRITPVGRCIRLFHLDELPQLVNVLKGEMSLVGPRPERPEFVQQLAREVPGYLERLAVRPGITGLAQINLPPDTNLDSVRRKLVLDLEYVEEGGPGLDLRILAATLLRMFGVNNQFGLRLLRLKRTPDIAPAAAPDGPRLGDPGDLPLEYGGGRVL